MIVVQQPEPPTYNPPADGIHAEREHHAGVDRGATVNRGSLPKRKTKRMTTRTTVAVSTFEPPGTSSTPRTASTNV